MIVDETPKLVDLGVVSEDIVELQVVGRRHFELGVAVYLFELVRVWDVILAGFPLPSFTKLALPRAAKWRCRHNSLPWPWRCVNLVGVRYMQLALCHCRPWPVMSGADYSLGGRLILPTPALPFFETG